MTVDKTDAWEIFDKLSQDAKERIYQAVYETAYPSMPRAAHIDPAESKEALELLEVLKQERKRWQVSSILEKFLPTE